MVPHLNGIALQRDTPGNRTDMKRTTFLSMLFAAAALLVVCGPAAWAQKIYVNGMDAAFPPFAFVDKGGKPSGFDVEALDWIAAKTGLTVKHLPMNWTEVLPALTAGKVDMIASGMSVTPERSQVADFTNAYYQTVQVLVSRTDNPASFQELLTTGKTIGAQRGAVTSRLLKSLSDSGGYRFELALYDTTEDSMKDLASGRIAASGMDSTLAAVMLGDNAFKTVGVFDAPPEKFAYAVRKGDVALLEKLNAGLALLMKDPYWAELKKKYGLR